MLSIFLFVVFSICICQIIANEDVVITIENGAIQGTKDKIVDKEQYYYSFRGVPYALPPLNELRFMPPQPAKNWSGILRADKDPKLCLQGYIDIKGSEDCLYLSFYLPKLPSNNDTYLPIMVYFIEDTFSTGEISKDVYGPDYFMIENVIILLANCRLGIFGYFSTEDENAPGNIALKDQSHLLRWINRNAKYFGGDKNKVTIFGQSSSAVATSLHLQSSLSRGLFHGAIMMSGFSLCSWSLSLHARYVSFLTGVFTGIITTNSKTLVTKLQKVDGKRLIRAYSLVFLIYALTHNTVNGLPLGPVIEKEGKGAFFTSNSRELLSSGKYNVVPTILGDTSMEGELKLTIQSRLFLQLQTLFNVFYVPKDMNIKSIFTKIKVGLQIKRHYWKFLIPFWSSGTNEFFDDEFFLRPMTEMARLLYKSSNSTYLYKFSYQGKLGDDRTKSGVLHGDDVNYYWERNLTASDTDKLVRKRQLRMWTNFAKFQKPTLNREDSVLGNFDWENVGTSNSGDVRYLSIEANLTMKNNLSKNMKFWDNIYKKYARPPFKTY